MKKFLINLGRKNFYSSVVLILIISDLSIGLHLKNDLSNQDEGAEKLLSVLPEQNLAFARELYQLLTNSILTALCFFFIINLINYFFFIKGRKFSYHYTLLMLRLGIPMSFITAYSLSKEGNTSAIFFMLEGFLFCLMSYAFRYYPYNDLKTPAQ